VAHSCPSGQWPCHTSLGRNLPLMLRRGITSGYCTRYVHTPLTTHHSDDDLTERDHILGMSFSPRLYFTHISIWTKQGNNLRSILLLERAIVEGLSADLRPRSDTELNYRKHVDKIGLSVQGQENRIPQMPPMTTSRPVLLRAMTAG